MERHRTTTTVGFWDGYACWYKLWMEHNHYHNKIIDLLAENVVPSWRVLDIGAGNGVLSLPLYAMGCEVTALEPSIGMRKLLYAEAFSRGIDRLPVNALQWQQVPLHFYRDLDLIMACNSLHLTENGFEQALDRIFEFEPRRVFLVSELYPGMKVLPERDHYALRFAEYFETESSFAYHNIGEVSDHWTYKKGSPLSDQELHEVTVLLSYQKGHLWIRENAMISMFWWEREGLRRRRYL